MIFRIFLISQDSKIKELYNNCEELEEADIECSQKTNLWKVCNAVNLNRFEVDEILDKTSGCAEIFGYNTSLREQLLDFHVRSDCDENSIKILLNIIKLCEFKYDDKQAKIVISLLKQDGFQALNNFICLIEKSRELVNETSSVIQNIEDEKNLDILNLISDLAKKYKIQQYFT